MDKHLKQLKQYMDVLVLGTNSNSVAEAMTNMYNYRKRIECADMFDMPLEQIKQHYDNGEISESDFLNNI